MNNLELTLIILLLNYNRYNKYNNVIDTKYLKDNHKEIYYIYITLVELINVNNTDISLDELIAYFYAKHPDVRDNAVYEALFTQAKGIQVTDDVGDSILAAIKQRKTALELSEAAYQYTQGFATLDRVTSLAKEIECPTEAAKDETEYVTTDLDELLNQTIQRPGLRWRLDCLNKSLGSLRRGDFGFIFARPETGKTTFLASEISHMLTQTDKSIIWFNNEEQGNKVMLRLYQAYFGVTLQQLISNAKHYKMAWAEAVGNRFKLVDSAAISKNQVERTLEACSDVGLILVDQLDKIKGFEADRKDLALGACYQWSRELAKTYAPFIGVSQADGTGEGQKWLTMQNVADAKTAKQAEADWIAGIGKSHNPNEESIRFINLSKNKLQGDSDTVPELRHGRFEVLIEPQVARYKDIVNYG